MPNNAALLTDGYKINHRPMYPDYTRTVVSNLTPRSFKHALPGVNKALWVGGAMVVDKLVDFWDDWFFNRPKAEVIEEIEREFSIYQGSPYDASCFAELWDYGKLPITIKALREGTLVSEKIAVMIIYVRDSPFFWLVNYLETLISNLMWLPMNTATIAYQFKKLLLHWANKTDKSNIGAVEFQAHDFSMRGMQGLDSTQLSGVAHAMLFSGSDNIPCIMTLRKSYEKDKNAPLFHGVPATEHAVMSAGSKEAEIDTFRRLLKLFPTGLLSVVSDTWDLWKVCTEYLLILKEEILARDGKLVIRPDSGDPVDIICGKNPQFRDENYEGVWLDTPENKGVIELLWNIFGGTVNEQGYKVLDPHIGAIYGDSITLDRAEQICKRLEAKGFASTNIVLGIGSFTYCMNTRDTLGVAMKATYIEVLNPETGKLEGREIFKDPVTDSGMKKSAKGLIKVQKVEGAHGSGLVLKDQVTWQDMNDCETKVIFSDGLKYYRDDLTTIRNRINHALKIDKYETI